MFLSFFESQPMQLILRYLMNRGVRQGFTALSIFCTSHFLKSGENKLLRHAFLSPFLRYLQPRQLVLELIKLAGEYIILNGLEGRVKTSFPSVVHLSVFCDSIGQAMFPFSLRWLLTYMAIPNNELKDCLHQLTVQDMKAQSMIQGARWFVQSGINHIDRKRQGFSPLSWKITIFLWLYDVTSMSLTHYASMRVWRIFLQWMVKYQQQLGGSEDARLYVMSSAICLNVVLTVFYALQGGIALLLSKTAWMKKVVQLLSDKSNNDDNDGKGKNKIINYGEDKTCQVVEPRQAKRDDANYYYLCDRAQRERISKLLAQIENEEMDPSIIASDKDHRLSAIILQDHFRCSKYIVCVLQEMCMNAHEVLMLNEFLGGIATNLVCDNDIRVQALLTILNFKRYATLCRITDLIYLHLKRKEGAKMSPEDFLKFVTVTMMVDLQLPLPRGATMASKKQSEMKLEPDCIVLSLNEQQVRQFRCCPTCREKCEIGKKWAVYPACDHGECMTCHEVLPSDWCKLCHEPALTINARQSKILRANTEEIGIQYLLTLVHSRVLPYELFYVPWRDAAYYAVQHGWLCPRYAEQMSSWAVPSPGVVWSDYLTLAVLLWWDTFPAGEGAPLLEIYGDDA